MASKPASKWTAQVARPSSSEPTPGPAPEPAPEGAAESAVQASPVPAAGAPAAPPEGERVAPPRPSRQSATKAPREPAAGRRAAAPEPAPDSELAPARRRPLRVIKVPVNFRLPPECIDLLEDAIDNAAAEGVRLTKEAAVEAAIRAHYGSG